MISWEHLRFLALLIPTWLLLAAVAVTLAIPSKSAAGPSTEASVALVSQVDSNDAGGVAVQQHERELGGNL